VVTVGDLEKVQQRRLWPTRVIQWLQVQMQERILSRVLEDAAPIRVPALLRLFRYFPWLQRLPARLVGIGVRPEHVHTPAAPRPAARAS
jgi:hypothetical protein